MRAELDKLSSEAIAQIYDALHDLKAAIVHTAALDILWDRHATPGGEWEVRDQPIGNPNEEWVEWEKREVERVREQAKGAIDGWGKPLPSLEPSHRVVAHCSHGKGHRDQLHQVKRSLNWKYQDERGERTRSGVECTCGRRSDLEGRERRLEFKQRQLEPTARVWQTVMMGGIPHYQVCKFARCADDPEHAPNTMGDRCLCGGYLGIHNIDDKTDKFMPAY